MAAAVAIGAFGAHILKRRLAPEMFEVFEVGVRYHVYHALALFVVAWLSTVGGTRFVASAGAAFAAGIVVFSGSLYLYALTGMKAWAMVTPLGGLSFIAGWALLFFGIKLA
ncbi:MAG: DUF423 domain-containing protein [Elusimicrobia bacterium]|nr:DUF423 domain-containing protein [Elusimicrobiota bacterium]